MDMRTNLTRRARRRVLSGALALGMSLCAPLAATAESLADAMVGAYGFSGLLEQNRALLRAADEDVAVQVSSLRPVIRWFSEVQRQFGVSSSAQTAFDAAGFATNSATIGISAELMLFDFGQTQLAIDAAKETVLATREGLVAVEQQILLNAVAAYTSVIRQSEFVQLRINNQRLITQELRAARDRFEVGEVTRTDVALAEARLAEASAGLAQARGDLAQAQAAYRNAVGRSPGNLTSPQDLPETAASLDRAIALAVRNHPEIKRAIREVAVADINVLRAEAAMKPTVRLTGQLGATENFGSRAFSRNGTVGVEAGGPIYQGGRLSALVRQSMARRDAARGNLHVVRQGVSQDAANAFARLTVARASRTAIGERIRAARVAFEGVREEATLGARTTLDVLNAEQELLDARASLISALADEELATFQLLSAMGLLTAAHLNLNVPRYDPAQYYNLVRDAPVKSRQGEDLDRVLKALGKD